QCSAGPHRTGGGDGIGAALGVRITSTCCLLKQRPALDVEPRPSGAAVVVAGIGLDNVGENFRGFDQPRSGPVEIMMSVSDKDPAVLHGLEGMPSRLRDQRVHLGQALLDPVSAR